MSGSSVERLSRQPQQLSLMREPPADHERAAALLGCARQTAQEFNFRGLPGNITDLVSLLFPDRTAEIEFSQTGNATLDATVREALAIHLGDSPAVMELTPEVLQAYLADEAEQKVSLGNDIRDLTLATWKNKVGFHKLVKERKRDKIYELFRRMLIDDESARGELLRTLDENGWLLIDQSDGRGGRRSIIFGETVSERKERVMLIIAQSLPDMSSGQRPIKTSLVYDVINLSAVCQDDQLAEKLKELLKSYVTATTLAKLSRTVITNQQLHEIPEAELLPAWLLALLAQSNEQRPLAIQQLVDLYTQLSAAFGHFHPKSTLLARLSALARDSSFTNPYQSDQPLPLENILAHLSCCQSDPELLKRYIDLKGLYEKVHECLFASRERFSQPAVSGFFYAHVLGHAADYVQQRLILDRKSNVLSAKPCTEIYQFITAYENANFILEQIANVYADLKTYCPMATTWQLERFAALLEQTAAAVNLIEPEIQIDLTEIGQLLQAKLSRSSDKSMFFNSDFKFALIFLTLKIAQAQLSEQAGSTDETLPRKRARIVALLQQCLQLFASYVPADEDQGAVAKVDFTRQLQAQQTVLADFKSTCHITDAEMTQLAAMAQVSVAETAEAAAQRPTFDEDFFIVLFNALFLAKTGRLDWQSPVVKGFLQDLFPEKSAEVWEMMEEVIGKR